MYRALTNYLNTPEITSMGSYLEHHYGLFVVVWVAGRRHEKGTHHKRVLVYS